MRDDDLPVPGESKLRSEQPSVLIDMKIKISHKGQKSWMKKYIQAFHSGTGGGSDVIISEVRSLMFQTRSRRSFFSLNGIIFYTASYSSY